MLDKNKILIVIVSYNDPVSLNGIVDLIDCNLYDILIFDNSSNIILIENIKIFCQTKNINLIGSGNNIGIGSALNCCLDYALKHGYEWILTFDQDSRPDGKQLDALNTAIKKYPLIMSFASCFDINGIDRDKFVAYSITSGNLVNVTALKEVGGYNEDFFIDGVDFDISLKLRRRGFKIIQIADAKMHHRIGIQSNNDAKKPTLLYARHVPERRYYQTKNMITLSFRYFLNFPFFISKLFIIFLFSTLLSLIFDDQRFATARMIYFGLLDSITRKKRNLFN